MDAIVKPILLIPTYNERENIEALLAHVFKLPISLDVLVIDDSSPDGTAQQIKKCQKKYNHLYLLSRKEKKGIGTAYVEGFRYALEHAYTHVLEMDADFSHNPEDLPRLLSACVEEGYDMAIGSRYVRGVNVVNWPMTRVLLSYVANSYVRTVLGLPIRDATAGFVCYTRTFLEYVNLEKIRFTGYAFQIEMKYMAWRHGIRIKEVSVVFTDRTRGKSKMSMQIFNEAFWGVLRLKMNTFFKKYKPLSLSKLNRSQRTRA